MATSPKDKKSHPGLLARVIADALASFCEIDEGMVSSRLIKKSNISLENLRLIPRLLQETDDQIIEAIGSVESVTFKWKWNVLGKKSKKHNSKGYMKKSTLTIKGVDVKIRARTKSNRDETSTSFAKKTINDETATSIFSDESTNEEKKGFRKKFVKNLVDQLAVHIMDLKITIEPLAVAIDGIASRKKEVVIEGKHISLVSMGREKNVNKKTLRKKKGPLLEELNLGSLSVRLAEIDERGIRRMHPIVDPFRYSAKLKRFYGERFSGLAEGVEITGQEIRPVIMSHQSSSDLPSNAETRDSATDLDYIVEDIGPLNVQDVDICVKDQEIEASLFIDHSESCDSVPPETLYDEQREDHRDVAEDASISQEGLNINLGDQQSIALFGIIHMFTLRNGVDNHTTRELEKGTRLLLKTISKPGGLHTHTTLVPNSFMRSTVHLHKSGLFYFPFRDVSLTLPNKAKCHLQDCTLKIRSDGSNSVFIVHGGASVNKGEVLSADSSLTIDIVKRQILIEKKIVQSGKYRRDPLMFDEDLDFNINLSEVRELSLGLGHMFAWNRRLMDARNIDPPATPNELKWAIKLNG
eukprot:CAMPEP_0194099806 /NCGR_PEP_ID=MMETSP0150-20130528/879_1 /TAXON_ID=122233 /ORGANISM="Chaetoceros debilis, Strain MM31A-1" /LENGTH=581 /DNA_ID=CAMNT_0038786065 /DNA_START=122 /DNA_END=1864 /DNA_ORIENTATION=-